MLRHLLRVALVSILTCAPTAAVLGATPTDDTTLAPPDRSLVATVNGRPLPRTLLERAFLDIAEHYAKFGPGLPIERLWSYRLDALSKAVEEQLVIDEARSRGLAASPEALGDSLEKLKAEITPLPPIGEEDLRSQFATITLRAIAVRRRSGERWGEAEREARQRAEDVLHRLRDGADFAALAAAASDDGRSKDCGGLAEAVLVSSLNPDRRKAVSSLDVGAFSELIRTDVGYEILRVEERGYRLPLDYEAQQPLLRARLAVERQEQAWQDHVKALRDGAAVTVTDPELLAYALLREGDEDSALALLTTASNEADALGPAGAASVFFQLGARYSVRERWAEAAAAYASCDRYAQQVLHLFPQARVAALFGLAHTHENLALRLREQGRTEEAETAATRAVEYYREVGLHTDNPSHHDRLRLAYLRLGRADLAEREAAWLAHRRSVIEARPSARQGAPEPTGEDR